MRLLLTSLFLVLPVCSSAQDWPRLVPNMVTSVVRIEMVDDDGNKGACSGVVLDVEKRLVLTAAHCIPVGRDGSLTVASRHAEVKRVNRSLDLAILESDKLPSDTTALLVASEWPVIGTSVAIVGFPFGDRRVGVQIGSVAQVYDEKGKPEGVVNADIIPGDSGGAAVDTHGRLIGLLSAIRYNGPAHLGVVVPADVIQPFVEGYLVKK